MHEEAMCGSSARLLYGLLDPPPSPIYLFPLPLFMSINVDHHSSGTRTTSDGPRLMCRKTTPLLFWGLLLLSYLL